MTMSVFPRSLTMPHMYLFQNGTPIEAVRTVAGRFGRNACDPRASAAPFLARDGMHRASAILGHAGLANAAKREEPAEAFDGPPDRKRSKLHCAVL